MRPCLPRDYCVICSRRGYLWGQLAKLNRPKPSNQYFVLVGIAAIVGGVGYGWSQQALRSRMVERLWRIPALGGWMKVYQLGRLYRTLGMLLRSGVPALRSLDMVSGLLPGHLRPQLARAMTLLNEGATISFALTSVGLATPVATRMMSVGEKSGRMGELLDRIARFYDDMTARSVDAFTRIFEPLLMTALGLAVGLIVILMYMPIFELAGGLQ